MSELNSKVIPSENSFNHLSALQDQLDVIDADTVCFFKLSLFKNVPPDYSSIHEFFTQYVYRLIKDENKNSFLRFYLVFSFYSFKTRFLELIKNDGKKLRNRWLIAHCNIAELYGLDVKASQHYFQSLETKKALEYISNFTSIDNWIRNEYKKVRLQLFFSVLKKNSNLIVFWFVILFFFALCLIFAAKDNSFTLASQIKVWMHFIFGKN